ncbi:MAG: hypothetical protein JRJ39_00185 [Deltaproteobacteria bacterium]|nr:hypothetical protein [Deltaproteobacteria bacterium]MBW2334503.1 hypothetical protein [Deltaproteobacteria bacterium]
MMNDDPYYIILVILTLIAASCAFARWQQNINAGFFMFFILGIFLITFWWRHG